VGITLSMSKQCDGKALHREARTLIDAFVRQDWSQCMKFISSNIQAPKKLELPNNLFPQNS
jgi:hypothetical protein